MSVEVNLRDDQLQKLLSFISSFKDHTPHWERFLITAAPIFVASLLGFGSALLIDHLKTRKEKQKVIRERREKELSQLSWVSTSLAFNVESLIHLVMQQILPHYSMATKAFRDIEEMAAGKTKTFAVGWDSFSKMWSEEFSPIMRRCPEPFFNEIDLLRELPFLVEHDPEILILSGWVTTYARNLKAIVGDRNKQIEIGTSEIVAGRWQPPVFQKTVAIQVQVGGVEVVNAYQLLIHYTKLSKKISGIIKANYSKVTGPKLKPQLPEIFEKVKMELERLSKEIVPDWPPPDPNEP